MTHDKFEQVLKARQAHCREILLVKAKEYAAGEDRLQNFKDAASALGCTPEEALWGMYIKHFISLQDIVQGRVQVTPGLMVEKITDSQNYMHLLEALFIERMQKDGTL